MKLLHISFALLLIFSLPVRAQDDKGKPRRFSPQEFATLLNGTLLTPLNN